MVILLLVFKGVSILFSIVAAPIYIPTNSVGGFLFSTSSLAFIICRLFDDGHSDWCEVISHCSLGCISLIISHVEHLYVGHLYVYLGLLLYGWTLDKCLDSLMKSSLLDHFCSKSITNGQIIVTFPFFKEEGFLELQKNKSWECGTKLTTPCNTAWHIRKN